MLGSNFTLGNLTPYKGDTKSLSYAILTLLLCLFWYLFIILFNSRLFGFIISFLVQKLSPIDRYAQIGSISISLPTGRIMMRDIVYSNKDMSIRCCYFVLTFNYWHYFDYSNLKKEHNNNRCLKVDFYGLDIHVYNRFALYDELKQLIENSNKTVNEVHTTSEVSDVLQQESASFMYDFWKKYETLFPAIKFELCLTKICFGNELLPRSLILTCSKIIGSYVTKEATHGADEFQHYIDSDYENFAISLIQTKNYRGQYKNEEGVQKDKSIFIVLKLGEGKFTYIQDEAGLVSHEPDVILLCKDDESPALCRTWPEWKLHIIVDKVFNMNYGPWVDRHRDILWRFFFPPSYEPMQVNGMPISSKQRRVFQNFEFKIQSNIMCDLKIPYIDSKQCYKFLYIVGEADSSLRFTLPWITNPSGYVSRIRIALSKARLTVQEHAWPRLLFSNSLVLDFNLNYPRHWNAPQSWDVNIEARHAKLMFLFDHKNVFRDLINDWSRDSKPDIMTFVPFTYRFRIKAHQFEFIMLANDYNWISSGFENSYLSIFMKTLSVNFDLPLTKFCPNTIPLNMQFEASSLIARISVPVTSTSLYSMRELHSNLRFVNTLSFVIKNNPFNITEEQMSEGGELPKIVWIDCWKCLKASLTVNYVYHPQPYVEDLNRFLSGQRKRLVPEDDFLRQLRPEGFQSRGPTHEELSKNNFDPTYMEPDIVDVHLTIPSSQLLCHGMLLRLFIHVKENYLGVNQVPVLFKDGPLTSKDHFTHNEINSKKKYVVNPPKTSFFVPESNTVTSNFRRISQIITQNSSWQFQLANDMEQSDSENVGRKIIDPRHYRPFGVRVSVNLHNIQAHIPLHSNVSNPIPCPNAFLDCISFEMDKKYRGTRMQVVVSPVLLNVYDMNHSFRPKDNRALSFGRVQLAGLQFRGHAMFSGLGLPLDSELLEYAWLMELTIGSLTGQLTAPQLANIVQVLNTFVHAVLDVENEFENSVNYEICQHGYPQQVCPHWKYSPYPEIPKLPWQEELFTLCPTESALKYKMLRVFIDDIDLAIVENGASLELRLDPIRVSTCNLHEQPPKNGLTLVLPKISLVQYLRSVEQHLEKGSEIKFPGILEFQNKEDSPADIQRPDIYLNGGWFEAGSVEFGPLHVNGGFAPSTANSHLFQSQFLHHHDQETRRLWFIWPQSNTSAPSMVCGCYGGCEFFGQNLMGRALHEEIRTGNYKVRTLFPPKSEYMINVDPDGVSFHMNNTKFSDRSLQFGESLILPGQLIFESHSQLVCNENQNGINLMRREIWERINKAFSNKMKKWSEKVEKLASQTDSGIDIMKAKAESILTSDELSYCEFCSTSDIFPQLELDSSDEYYETDSDIQSTQSSNTTSSKIRYNLNRLEINHSTESELHLLPESDGRASNYEPSPTSSMKQSHSKVNFWKRKAHKLKVSRHYNHHKQLEEESNLAIDSSVDHMNHKMSEKILTDAPLDVEIGGVEMKTYNSTESLLMACLADSDDEENNSDNQSSRPEPNKPPPPPRQSDLNAYNEKKSARRPKTLIPEKKSASQYRKRSLEEDNLRKLVDLSSKLHRPITESVILKSAYARHLNQYECVQNWAEPFSVKSRWYLCKKLESGDNETLTICRCIGKAHPPIFIPRKQGLSTQLMVARPDAYTHEEQFVEEDPDSQHSPTQRNDLSQKADNLQRFNTDQSSSISLENSPNKHPLLSGPLDTSLRSSATIWLEGPINMFFTPLFVEALDRYISMLVPVMAQLPPSAAIDAMHYRCISNRSQVMTKPLENVVPVDDLKTPDRPKYNQKRPTNSANMFQINKNRLSVKTALETRANRLVNLTASNDQTTISPSSIESRSNLLPNERLSKLSTTGFVNIAKLLQPSNIVESHELPAFPVKSENKVKTRKSTTDSDSVNSSRERVQDHILQQSLKIGAFSVERINICFMQLYAVEEIVHVDTLKSGLLDLSCVSLMSFAVDAIAFDIMLDKKWESDVPIFSNYLPLVVKTDLSPERKPRNDLVNDVIIRENSANSGPKKTLSGSIIPEHSFGISGSNKISQKIRRLTPNSQINRRSFGNRGNRYESLSAFTPHDDIEITNPFPEINDRGEQLATAFMGHNKRKNFFGHRRQPSAPPDLHTSRNSDATVSHSPLLTPQKFEYSDERPCSVEHQKNTELPDLSIDSIRKNAPRELKEPSQIRHAEQLIGSLRIKRIHGQLRRLTRNSEFNSNVLLTAIPFKNSRVLFAFQSDPHALSTIPPLTPEFSDFGRRFINLRPPLKSCGDLQAKTSGWIMFECGLESLNLTCLRRIGYPEDPIQSFEDSESSQQLSFHKHSTNSLLISRPMGPSEDDQVDVQNGTSARRYSAQPNLESFNNAQQEIKPTSTIGQKNALLGSLKVVKVWLNFPAPKRLPNKRRIEIIRSDWNLLSTVMPMINAWIHPCDRFVVSSKKLRNVLERRLLAVTTCLMSQWIHQRPRTFGSNLTLRRIESNSDHPLQRRQKSRDLRYDPSCQVFTQLRRYLQELRSSHGNPGLQYMLNEWLKDSLVPQYYFLQWSILALTREWRFNVDNPILDKEDRIKSYSRFKKGNDSLEPLPRSGRPVQDIDQILEELIQNDPLYDHQANRLIFTEKCVDSIQIGQAPLRNAEIDFKRTLFAPRFQTISTSYDHRSPLNFLQRTKEKLIRQIASAQDKDSQPTNLLRLLDKFYAVSPNIDSEIAMTQKIERPIENIVSNVNTEIQRNSSFAKLAEEDEEDVESLDLSSLTKQEKEILQNVPIMKKFLVDAIKSSSESSKESTENENIEPFKRQIPVQNIQNNTNTLNTDISFQEKSVNKHMQEMIKDLTKEDLQKATHLSAQYEAIKDVRKLFQPLLEAVGLNEKGVQRTTLMNKFGGFFSADGILETFEIDIIKSADNPLQKRMSVSETSKVSGSSTDPSYSVQFERSQNSAFLCRKFALNVSFRDQADVDISKSNLVTSRPITTALPYMTTNTTIILHIDFIRQHVNMPLLRLIHQFVTMTYISIDTRNLLERRKILTERLKDVHPSDLMMLKTPLPSKGHRKQDSYESSDYMVSTLTSSGSSTTHNQRNSGNVVYTRMSEDNDYPIKLVATPDTDNSGSSQHHVVFDTESGNVQYSKSTISRPHGDVTVAHTTGSSQNSMSPDLEKISNGSSSRHQSIYYLPTPIGGPSGNVILPECWSRLYTYVQYFTTVPDFKTVSKKTSSKMPTIQEECGHPTSDKYDTSNHKALKLATQFISEKELLASMNTYGTMSMPNKEADIHFLDEVSKKKNSTQKTAIEKIAYPWLRGQRVPYVVFMTAKVREMNISAVLSELKLNAIIRNSQGSMSMNKVLYGHGKFTDKNISYSVTVHYDDCKIRLLEGSKPNHLEVACVQMARSHLLISCTIGRALEKNALMTNLGTIIVKVPHHPVQLHGVMQRQAKRISHTVSELLRIHQPEIISSVSQSSLNTPISSIPLGSNLGTIDPDSLIGSLSVGSSAPINNSGILNEHASVPGTGSECSSQLSSAQNTQRGSGSGQGKDSSFSSADGKTRKKTRPMLEIHDEPTLVNASKVKESNAPLTINIVAVAQGFSLDVALHPGLEAVYRVDPVYLIGKIGSASHVDISLAQHSLSFRSDVEASILNKGSYPENIILPLPRILTSVSQKKSAGGLYFQDKFQLATAFINGKKVSDQIPKKTKLDFNKNNEAILTEGLRAEEGTYLDIQASVGTLKQNLTTDKLNYIMVVAKLFAKEIGEIVQKMAGDEPLFERTGTKPEGIQKLSFDLAHRGKANVTSVTPTLVKTKISLKIRQQGIHLMATTENGAIKFETNEIDIEVTNRVCPSKSKLQQNIRKRDAWVLFITFDSLSLELGHLIQDIYYEERGAEFKTLAFFRTAIALRSLFADEVTGKQNNNTIINNAQEREAFLITLRRPIFCFKPQALDRAILLMLDYKRELVKWKDRFNQLSSMAPVPVSSHHTGRLNSNPGNVSLRTPIVSSHHGSTSNPLQMMFFQLCVDDLGFCLPTDMIIADSSGDTGMALVLTLNRSRISACYKDSLVSEGEFTDFCLRFEDDFLIGSDDWQPDHKKCSFIVRDSVTPQLMIMNGCTVPKGTFIVCSKAPDLLSIAEPSSWVIAVQWQMCGLDVHMDSSIGRRLHTLTSTLTDMTGYYDDHATALNQNPVGESSYLKVNDPLNTARSTTSHDALYAEYTYNTSHLRGLERESRQEEFQKALECQSIKRNKWHNIKNKTNLISSVKRVGSLKTKKPAGLEVSEFKSDIPKLHEKLNNRKSRQKSDLLRKSYDNHRTQAARSTSSIAAETHNAASQQRNSASVRCLVSSAVSASSLNEFLWKKNLEDTLSFGFGESLYLDAKDETPNLLRKNLKQSSSNSSPGSCDRFEDSDIHTETLKLSKNERINEKTQRKTSTSKLTDDSFDTEFFDLSETDSSDYYQEIDEKPPKLPPRQNTIGFLTTLPEPQPEPNQTDVTRPTESSISLLLNVSIHVDSGKCVLHPRLPQQSSPTRMTEMSPFALNDLRSRSKFGIFAPHITPSSTRFAVMDTNFTQGSNFLPSSGIMSTEEKFAAYLERFRRFVIDEKSNQVSDLTIFYLPAVHTSLRYNSKTEMDGPISGSSTESPKVSNFDSTNAQQLPKFRKQAELYASCSFQTLPKQLIISPSLLDFLEQALENISFEETDDLFSDYDTGVKDIQQESTAKPIFTTGSESSSSTKIADILELVQSSDDDKNDEFKRRKPSSQASLNSSTRENPRSKRQSIRRDRQSSSPYSHSSEKNGVNTFLLPYSETFPVDVVVHIHVKPSTILLVFSTKRQTPNDDIVFRSSNISAKHDSPIKTQNLAMTSQDCLMAETGLCVTAILNEFELSIFHPFSSDITRRSITLSGSVPMHSPTVFAQEGKSRPGGVAGLTTTSVDHSLNLLVRNVNLNISRTVQTHLSFIQNENLVAKMPFTTRTVQLLPYSKGYTMTTNTFHLVDQPLNESINRSGSLKEGNALHNRVQFSGLFDTGIAQFKCDTRRMIEILDIPKAWYRKSLARRLFLGSNSAQNETVASTIPNSNINLESPLKKPENEEKDPKIGESKKVKKQKNYFYNRHNKDGNETLHPDASADKIDSIDSTTQYNQMLHKPKIGISGLRKRTKVRSSTVPTPNALKSNRDSNSGVDQLTGFGSKGGSLKVASWQAIPIFFANLRKLHIHLYIGSALANTELIIDRLFCYGSISLNSMKKKDLKINLGLDSCKFDFHKGIVAGELAVQDFITSVRIKEDLDHDPEHSLDLALSSVQTRCEYMNANLLFARGSHISLQLADSWQIQTALETIQAEHETSIPFTVGINTKRSEFASGTVVSVRVEAEFNWSQLHMAIARNTTPDIIEAIRYVTNYFKEQLQQGRQTLFGLEDFDTSVTKRNSNYLFSSNFDTFNQHSSTFDDQFSKQKKEHEKHVEEILERHWQLPMREAIKIYHRKLKWFILGSESVELFETLATISKPVELVSDTSSGVSNSVPPILGGTLQLSGNALAVACFSGTFRSASDWAVFNMQHPTVCFETEAQREMCPKLYHPNYQPSDKNETSTSEPISSDLVNTTTLDSTISVPSISSQPKDVGSQAPENYHWAPEDPDGWINLRQVLSFEFYAEGPQLHPHMAYVLRVDRGREEEPRSANNQTIANWMEFIFKAADKSIVNFVRNTNPNLVPTVVKVTEFESDLEKKSQTSKVLENSDVHEPQDTFLNQERSNGANGPSKAIPNPIRPPNTAEMLFVLPSISLRLVSDQQQPMNNLFYQEFFDREDDESETRNNNQLTPDLETKSTPLKPVVSESSTKESKSTSYKNKSSLLTPQVKLSFQTDFHGAIQLGHINVPWLPTLIKDYIKDMEKQAPKYDRQAENELKNFGRTNLTTIQDAREYHVIHWNLSPEFRWLVASNIGVPVVEKFLGLIGFTKGRATIPKWLQRGLMDRLDLLLANLVNMSLQLIPLSPEEKEITKSDDTEISEDLGNKVLQNNKPTTSTDY